MTEGRPDPDQLLAQVQAEEARAQRGRLRVFFGASAGVGKTYAMLEAALVAKAAGDDKRSVRLKLTDAGVEMLMDDGLSKIYSGVGTLDRRTFT